MRHFWGTYHVVNSLAFASIYRFYFIAPHYFVNNFFFNISSSSIFVPSSSLLCLHFRPIVRRPRLDCNSSSFVCISGCRVASLGVTVANLYYLCTYCIPGHTKARPPGTKSGFVWQHPVEKYTSEITQKPQQKLRAAAARIVASQVCCKVSHE